MRSTTPLVFGVNDGSASVASVPIALFASRLVQSFLFEVKPNDPYTIVSAVGVLVLAVLLAGCAPARRAARISPAIALRAD